MSNIACTGRSARFLKNRRDAIKNLADSNSASRSLLDASMGDTGALESSDRNARNVDDEDARKFFTVWSVSYTTATITTTFVNTAVTVKLSAMCFPSGEPVPPACDN